MSVAEPIQQPETFLSRGLDYLGDLGAKLRDLQGDRTLAHELIQNADDAPTATSMCFDVTPDALVVDNDGVFSDCGSVEQAECPWKAARGHRCDFHRMRNIASGDKRSEPNTTGAFGIGFITVYQITDKPGIISNGRHWTLREEQTEDRRIEVCHGCSNCRTASLPGTRLILPWAQVPSSLRTQLQIAPVSEDRPARILEQLLQSVPAAMLFLKRLRSIEVKANGHQKRLFQRLDEGDSLILSDGCQQNDQVWHLLHGDFSAAANALRSRHSQIEQKRRSEVSIAIPAHSVSAGLLYACLPTEHEIPLPFYIDADFFPSNDRKHVLFAEDYQSEWNREGLRAAAHAFAARIPGLTTLLGPKRFWELLKNTKDTADVAQRGTLEPTLSDFWSAIEPQLKTSAVVFTNSSQWRIPSETHFPLQKEEEDAIPLLEALGVHFVHEDLRPHLNLLRSDSIGVPLIDIRTICNVLKSHGLDKPVGLAHLPHALQAPEQRARLWEEVTRLLERSPRTSRPRLEAEQLLCSTAIAPGPDGLWPCAQIFNADDATISLFGPLGLGVTFLANETAFSPLANLCRRFDSAAAVEVLESHISTLHELWSGGNLPLSRIMAWFEDRRQEVLDKQTIKNGLADLPIYPSSGKLCSLKDVALPGDFDDPLGLAQLIDLPSLGGRREFLRDLGMSELGFLTYATVHLPAALAQPDVPAEKRRMAITLLAEQAGRLKDQNDTIAALRSTPLVECEDVKFRRPDECYFSTSLIRDCLRDASYAVIPEHHRQSVHDLFAILGVAESPRLQDIFNEIHRLSREPYSESATRRIEKIIAYLAKWLERANVPNQLIVLRATSWLPARGKADRWYRSNELYASYQKELFESQALFLDLPIELQRNANQLLAALGINLAPSVDLVVKHLRHCAHEGKPVHSSVYRFLNDKAGDRAINGLRSTECLWLDDGYKSPQQVFWSDHKFGQYRWRLDEELRSYHKLLTQLDVKEAPDAEDGLKVLGEISTEFGVANRPLDPETHSVVMACWHMLEGALGSPSVANKVEALRTVKCVPNEDVVLYPPEWVFFENRAGLANKFAGFLTKNVISRPIGATNALQLAGVRQLGAAVQIELLECDDPTDDLDLTQRIQARRNEIGRVLESQTSGTETLAALSRLDDLRCRAAASLVIRHRVHAFSRELTSPPEDVPALYDPQQHTLIYAKRDRGIPWSAIARELAIALFPDEDPGRFAAGLKEVIAPQSTAEASTALDELGFARLDTTVYQGPEAAHAGGQLGAEQSSAGEGPSPAAQQQLSPEEAVNQLLGPNAPPPTPPITDDTPEGATSPGGSPGKAGATKPKKRPVLRSYVPSPDATEGEKTEDQVGNGRSPVDIAGIRRVMTYEISTGRRPKEMPHNNPGYDIESRDPNGSVLLRYIEVKSFSGDWDSTYAVLSRDQFDKANQEREKFWLYVVEHAENDDEFRLHRIQNPARKANHFMFDDGWRATAEPNVEPANAQAAIAADSQSD